MVTVMKEDQVSSQVAPLWSLALSSSTSSKTLKKNKHQRLNKQLSLLNLSNQLLSLKLSKFKNQKNLRIPMNKLSNQLIVLSDRFSPKIAELLRLSNRREKKVGDLAKVTLLQWITRVDLKMELSLILPSKEECHLCSQLVLEELSAVGILA